MYDPVYNMETKHGLYELRCEKTGLRCFQPGLTQTSVLSAVSGVGPSSALATRETSQVLLAGVSGGFPGALPFRPTYRLARLDMSDIILKGTLN